MLAFLDNSGEFLAGLLRPGNAGANTATDHIAVLDQALAQIPDAARHGSPVLIRADGAGGTKAFLAHVRELREQQVLTEFSVGWAVTDRERAAIGRLPARAWTPALDAEGGHRDGAHVAELSGEFVNAIEMGNDTFSYNFVGKMSETGMCGQPASTQRNDVCHNQQVYYGYDSTSC